MDLMKTFLLDMEARERHLCEIADHYETLRDSSHIRCLLAVYVFLSVRFSVFIMHCPLCLIFC